ncbi:MAG: CHAT domain-containing protein [Candidatus Magnetomorum sp.]|nr:CHAT domain-containing protein [Candidatus Magnetomorum sp.]
MKSKSNDIQLTISLQKPGKSISSYQVIETSKEKIKTHCRKLIETINQSARQTEKKQLSSEWIKETGQILCDELLPSSIKQALRTTTASCLILKLDDYLVDIPWELLCLNNQFLCQRFNMGRVVMTRQSISETDERKDSGPKKLWILANPCGDLPGAASEGLQICDFMDEISENQIPIIADMDTSTSIDKIKTNIRNSDFVHFAGHVNYHPRDPEQSGWKLPDKKLFTVRDVDKMSGSGKMPDLIFSNACQSARTEEWEWKENARDDSSSLVNAYMRAGVKHYLGTNFEIMDEPGSRFAITFYKKLLSGMSIGQSVKEARIELMNEDPAAFWSAYILYGDPTISYFGSNESETNLIILEATTDKKRSSETEKSDTSQSWKILSFVAIGLTIFFALLYFCYLPDLGSSKNLVDPTILKIFIEQEKEKQQTIAIFIKEYIKSNQASENNDANKSYDSWTSKPLTIAVVVGDSLKSFLNRGADNLMASAIEKEIKQNTRLIVLDRLSLDGIINELSLSNSDLVSEKNKISPNLLTANLLIDLQLRLDGENLFVIMRLKETQSGRLLDTFREKLTKGPLLTQKKRIAKKLITYLKQNYPVRGRVLEITDKDIVINIGKDAGVRNGQEFINTSQNVVLTVISIKTDTSKVNARNKDRVLISKGMKIKEK